MDKNIMKLEGIKNHQHLLSKCSQCTNMIGPVITGNPVLSRVMSVGQAPGIREGEFQRPFAWTAGKTLFSWFDKIGVNEEDFRGSVYMAAVCRCFPGKNPKGGDRLPQPKEITTCSQWLLDEYHILQPDLIIPIGKLAIQQYLKFNKLSEVVGQLHTIKLLDKTTVIIPLPHPSGVSTWFRTEPGKTLLKEALQLIKINPYWQSRMQRSI